MSDTSTSGETPVQAPAETVSTPPAAAVPASFGTTRGSGLARGKRPSAPAPAPAAAPSGDYKPTSIQVIVAQREYQNPFAPATPVVAETPAPVEVQPVVAAVVEHVAPAPVEAPAPVVVAPVAPVAVEAPAPVAPITETPAPAAIPAEPAPKAELKILPTETPKRPAQSWEAPSFKDNNGGLSNAEPRRERREDRPVFSPQRRGQPRPDDAGAPGASAPKPEDARRFDPREPREPRKFEPREQRKFEPREPQKFEPREPRKFEPRDPRPAAFTPAPTPAPEAPKKSGGFMGWLKGLFGAPAEAPAAPTSDRPEGDQGGGDRPFDPNRPRRRRGGRGRNGGGPRFDGPRPEGGVQGGDRGPRPEGADQGGPEGDNGGERRFEGGGRRRRGGRGRNRGGPRFDGPRGENGGGDSPAS